MLTTGHVLPDSPRQPCLPGVERGESLTRCHELDEQALAFVRENPDFWQLFVRFVDEARERGSLRLGAKLVCERIRWEHVLNRGRLERGYLINNNHVSSIARIYCATYPENAFMFGLRARPSAQRRGKLRSVSLDGTERSIVDGQ